MKEARAICNGISFSKWNRKEAVLFYGCKIKGWDGEKREKNWIKNPFISHHVFLHSL
jgi:hypothetical protein